MPGGAVQTAQLGRTDMTFGQQPRQGGYGHFNTDGLASRLMHTPPAQLSRSVNFSRQLQRAHLTLQEQVPSPLPGHALFLSGSFTRVVQGLDPITPLDALRKRCMS